MKKIYVYILLIFFSFAERISADNINDFQIEGLSVEDNVFDYFTSLTLNQRSIDVGYGSYNKYALEAKTSYKDAKKEKPMKLMEIGISDDRLEVYDELYVTYFHDTTIITKVTGIKFFKNKYEICKKEKDKIVNDISDLLDDKFKLFSTDKLREDDFVTVLDPFGVLVDVEDRFLGSRQFSEVLFKLDSGGSIQVVCEDYDEKTARIDTLLVTINSKGLKEVLEVDSAKPDTKPSSQKGNKFVTVRSQQYEIDTRPKF